MEKNRVRSVYAPVNSPEWISHFAEKSFVKVSGANTLMDVTEVKRGVTLQGLYPEKL